jgi:tetratricopeptide (TPR) repeat protein
MNIKALLQSHKWPLVVGVVAVVVRLVYIFECSRSPDFLVPMVDEKWHWEWALQIVDKSFWGEGAYFRAPLYPYFLALLATVTGKSILWAKVLQSLLCFGTAIFVFRLAERLSGRTAAIASSLAYAFYGTLIFYETMFLVEVLFLFFATWGMYRFVACFDSTSLRSWLFTGVLLGLAAITRPNVLIAIPFLALWMYLRSRGVPSLLRRAVRPAVLVAGVGLTILPITVRNIAVTGEFILISSQGGINLYLGNNPSADGLTMLMPEVALDESVSWRQFGIVTTAAAEKATGRMLSESEVSAFWTSRALDFIRHSPGAFLSLVWRKCVYLVNGFENSDNLDIYYQRNRSLLYSLLVWSGIIYFPFGLLLPLAIVGVYACRHDSARFAPLYIYIVAYTPSIVLFLVTARHRLSLLPFLIVVAAAGVVALVRSWRALRMPQIVAASLLLVVPLLVVNRTYYELGRGGEFQVHFNNGIATEKLGDLAGAEKEYLLADAEYAYSAPLANNLAYVQFRQGKKAEAEANYLRAIRLQPGYAPAYHNYALLQQNNGRPDSALTLYRAALDRFDAQTASPDEVAQTLLNMAEVQEGLGDTAGAATTFDRALITAIGRTDVFFRAAGFYARQGRFVRSDSLFDIGARLAPPTAGDCFNYGLSLLRAGQLTAGTERMHQATTLDSTMYQAYFCLAAANRDLGRPTDSVITYLNLCLKYNPTYQPALSLQEQTRRP